ncbi:related to chitinase [Cephalotrichum gorgonifer]|uniref:chitinase n=1 Tax=Cephalotrichum gorgonifer TaxID=2041049 RepID=A0AAE8SZL4_9PEZI|nr:related to chitinase [Cephalotrichum gorgonifer]
MAPAAVLAVALSLLSQEVWAHPHKFNSINSSSEVDLPTCRAAILPFDFSAKDKRTQDLRICDASEVVLPQLFRRQDERGEDYSCSETKLCSNSKALYTTSPIYARFTSRGSNQDSVLTDTCGITGASPNDVCWSNCDAHAECGRYAEPAGKECPLNVCCSQFGFCGMIEEFCARGDSEEESCQSNCDQPGPTGPAGGDVRNRVIGYFEAWVHDRKCQNMDFDRIPVGALTHAYFSFGYITPGDFMIAPMDNLPVGLFSEFTDIKRKNSSLKTVIALGGWTFNDNHTATQPVFHNLASTRENRAIFITNLFAFMRKYGFDGVDFDWEYPGAPDRGGHDEDGKNFVSLLKELQEENKKQPAKYVVSFTIPTSYWYLRWFDLQAVDYADFVNIMSYDLHGVWDGDNPIGKHVFAHSNLTEIGSALDLLWRNNVPRNKLNLGLGFYGRSFTLVDPNCHSPGCPFLTGADKGPCSGEPGILTFREINDIIKRHNLEPYYDKENAVKYITWNQNQWVSYDDPETLRQKIDFANDIGLSGVLIWAIDQDADDLRLLEAVVGDGGLLQFQHDEDIGEETDADTWEVPDCYVTGCGGKCKAGFIKVEQQPCGGAKAVTRHSKEKDSLLCCPIQGAPDPADCTWRGSAPNCNGRCHDNEVTMQLNRWGDGKYCEDGNKVYCCESPVSNDHECYWAGVGKDCNGKDIAMTFSGTFLSTVVDIVDLAPLVGDILIGAMRDYEMEFMKFYCCPEKDFKRFKDCGWYGSPDTCFNNHCPVTGHSVQLTDSPYGFGESCFPRVERNRVFCCDLSDNKSPFLPVPLENLFVHPPEGDNIDTDFILEIDDTWGTGSSKTNDDADEPNDAAFQFVIMTSPEELQVSLDKRDGSHWELFNCNDAESEEPQTIQMICTDVSEDSNCHKIELGHGVPGTILQMPPGCGPGTYAVAKDMVVSPHQIVPRGFESLRHKPVVYDLTFDYDFSRVPRDLGNTQLRIDYSNEPGYWDTVVAAAASERKTKRSLEDVGGNHKRWLEETWRDDAYFSGSGAMDEGGELHKRWFADLVIDWLRRMLSEGISTEFTHDLKETYTAKIVEEQFQCPKYEGYVLAQALVDVAVSTSFGFTLITTLETPPDLSKSYLTFHNKGEIQAVFTLEAFINFHYESGEMDLLKIPFPGAGFRIPGIATIGPALALKTRLEASVSVSATMEARLDVASWEYDYRLPMEPEMEPETEDKPEYGNTGNPNGIPSPEFYGGVLAHGDAKAHLIAAVQFGIDFDQRWKVGAATAALVADGWIQIVMEAGISTEVTCPFTWGLNAGVDLYVEARVPDVFKWEHNRFRLPGSGVFPVYEGGQCPDLRDGSPDLARRRRSIDSGSQAALEWKGARSNVDSNDANATGSREARGALEKRATVIGPFISIPIQDMLCPNAASGGESSGTACGLIQGWEESDLTNALRRRSASDETAVFEDYKAGRISPRTELVSRATDSSRKTSYCSKRKMKVPPYKTSSTLNTRVPNVKTYGYTNPDDCNNFGFGSIPLPAAATLTTTYATEHILELQLVGLALTDMDAKLPALDNPDPRGPAKVVLCNVLGSLWITLSGNLQPILDGVKRQPVDHIMAVMPSNANAYTDEFVLLDKGVNAAKQGMFKNGPINSDTTMMDYIRQDPDKAIKNIKDVMTALKYMGDSTIRSTFIAQKERVAARLKELDEDIMPNVQKPDTREGLSWGRWKSQGMEGRWNTFMKDKTATALFKAKKHIDDYTLALKDGYAKESDRKAAEADTDVARDAARLIDKIDKLDAEWKRYKPLVWSNPF